MLQSYHPISHTHASSSSPQAFSSAPSVESHHSCVSATEPLLSVVEQLSVFASSPEFSTTSAVISPPGLAAQEPIHTVRYLTTLLCFSYTCQDIILAMLYSVFTYSKYTPLLFTCDLYMMGKLWIL